MKSPLFVSHVIRRSNVKEPIAKVLQMPHINLTALPLKAAHANLEGDIGVWSSETVAALYKHIAGCGINVSISRVGFKN